MIQFTNFDSFLDVIKSITKKDLEKTKLVLKNEGQNINIEDIFINTNGALFYLLPDGSLKAVNLYIALTETESHLFKYHIYMCGTLKSMFKNNRKHRYKVNTRTDETFYYTFTKAKKVNENQKLTICHNCLTKFKKLNRNVKFSLEYFHKNNKSFVDANFNDYDFELGENAKPNIYTKDWNKISKQIKQQKSYICENCGFFPKQDEHKKYIHTHHINGDKTNNFTDNLKVLCIKCHSNADQFHGIIKSRKDYKYFIQNIMKS